MAKHIVCNAEHFQLLLNCQQLDKNIFKVIKILNDIGELYILPIYSQPFSNKILQTITGKKAAQSETISQPTKIRQSYCHTLTQKEAIQIVWRSAYLTKQLGIFEKQLMEIRSHMLVGRQNSLKMIIEGLKSKKQESKGSDGNDLKKKIKKLKQMRKSVDIEWNDLQQQGLAQTKQNASENLLKGLMSISNIKMEQKERDIVMRYIRRKIVELDVKAFQKTILFIQEFQTEECLVSLEQCYPSFIVNKLQFKQIIGEFTYNSAVNRYKRAFKQAKLHQIQFTPKLFFKCHSCDNFTLNDTTSQFKRPISFCVSKAADADPSSGPYFYQQITLFSQYSHLADVYGKIKVPQDQQKVVDNELFNFKEYIHPYYKPHKPKCLRFSCAECCKQQNKTQQAETQKGREQQRQSETEQKKDKTNTDTASKVNEVKKSLPQFKQCNFCKRTCSCERCKIMTTLNKFIAIYEGFGGHCQQISEELVFLNFNNKKILLQLITFNNQELQNPIDPAVPVKRGRGRPKKIQKQDKMEKKQKKLKIVKKVKPWKQIIEERQLEQHAQNNTTQREYQQPNESGDDQNQQQGSQVDSRQIFVGLQSLFSQILVDEQKVFNCDDYENDPDQLSQFWIKKQQEFIAKRQEIESRADQFLVKRQQKEEEMQQDKVNVSKYQKANEATIENADEKPIDNKQEQMGVNNIILNEGVSVEQRENVSVASQDDYKDTSYQEDGNDGDYGDEQDDDDGADQQIDQQSDNNEQKDDDK